MVFEPDAAVEPRTKDDRLDPFTVQSSNTFEWRVIA